MLNNAALDVVIGLVFVYLLYSLLGSIVVEIIASNSGLRGRLLQKAIQRMLDDATVAPATKKSSLKFKSDKKQELEPVVVLGPAKPEVAKTVPPKVSVAFFAHPLIKYLRADAWFSKNMPSYIDPETFTKVLIDLLRGPEAKAGGNDRHLIEDSLKNRKIAWKVVDGKLLGGSFLDDKQETHISALHAKIEPETCMYLQSVWADSQGDVTKFKAFILEWYNQMMERTTGWYKKSTRRMLLIFGFISALLLNVDTIKLARLLESKPELRQNLISQVNSFRKANPSLTQDLANLNEQYSNLKKPAPNDKEGNKKYSAKKDTLKKQMDDNPVKKLQDKENNILSDYLPNAANTLGFGYPNGEIGANLEWYSPFGWVLTALAISMGASFWFDLLNKLMLLRSSLAPKDDTDPKPKTNQGPSPKKIDG